MTTEKLFWENPYLDKVTAKIINVRGSTVTLDRTIFYAFSGGQESDSGTINGKKVQEAKIVGNEIEYVLEPNHRLKEGDNVLIKIDWENRYKIMRLHFAAELILELVYQNYNRPHKIGANITSKKSRLDFDWEGNISYIFPELLEKFNRIVQSDLPIISEFSDRENERKYWQIKGFARVACGGTHIKRTGEIEGIILKRENIGRNKERIEIYLK